METSIESDIIWVNKLTGNLEHRKGPLQNFVWLLYLLKLPEITYIIHELCNIHHIVIFTTGLYPTPKHAFH